jgi:alpha-ribazole phosphatase/probable phosphoglycerate mutase
MGVILFIRHAETDLAGHFCGHVDPPLNERGRVQAAELVKRMQSDRFDAIYSSDLHRAVETAAPLAQVLAIPCTTTPALREIDFGEWEGLTWAQIEDQYGEYAQRWTAEFPHLPAPGGEPFSAFESRVLQEIDALTPIAQDKRLVVVTHGGVMRVVLHRLLGHTDQQAWEMTREFCSSFLFAPATQSLEANR